jgi:hypothetical protein
VGPGGHKAIERCRLPQLQDGVDQALDFAAKEAGRGNVEGAKTQPVVDEATNDEPSADDGKDPAAVALG